MTAVDYASELIKFDSVSSKSNVEVTDQVESWLKQLGFEVERLEYDDRNGVRKANVVGKLGTGTGGLAFFGHTDVVPANTWVFQEHGPFDPTIKDGKLFGRGSTDMKGPVACALAAAEAYQQRTLQQPFYLCCTADEEVGMLGAEQVANESQLYREMVTHNTPAIIGEPTQLEVVYGHKGGCSMLVTSRGKAAHSSTREGINANWKMIPFLQEMAALNEELETNPQWQNAEFNPPTMTLNLGINDYTYAINITPPQSVCTVYFRAMPGMNIDPLIERCQRAADANGLTLELRMRAQPMYVDKNSPFVQDCLQFASSTTPKTVAYGTDGAMFGDLQQKVVMGPGSIAQAHTHDEWIELEQLESGTATYIRMIERWCL